MWLESAAATVAGISFYSWFIEPRWRRIHRHTLSFPSSFHGSLARPIHILHLSDFHFYQGAHEKRRFIERFYDCEVDFIFITGDFIDDDSGIDLCLASLKGLKARYGVYAVLGNHDYLHISWRSLFHRTGTSVYDLYHEYNDSERLVAGLTQVGIQILRNERKSIDIDGTPVTIIGIDDPYTEHDDIPQAFDGYERTGPCFVLVHTPDCFRELSGGDVDLVLAGHTHGGQVCLPWWGPVITRTTAPRHMAYGFNWIDGTCFYTTRGIGTSRITRPRFLCPPEVNLFECRFE